MRLKTTVTLRRTLYIPITVMLLLSITVACKKSLPVPEALIDNLIHTVPEDVEGGSAPLSLTLSGTYDKIVSIDYSTTNGTAVAGNDFVAVTSGTITFQPERVQLLYQSQLSRIQQGRKTPALPFSSATRLTAFSKELR